MRNQNVPWQRVAAGAGLLGSDGAPAPTIFAEMSALAAETGAINLGQGFPDEDGPVELLDVAREAIATGINQYSPGRGTAELRLAIAEHQARFYGLRLDPDREVLVTAGATEALAAALLALVGPGDEVVVFEPHYDAYAADVALAGAALVTVPLRWPDFQPDLEQLAAAVTDRTRVILLNDPHNPTGVVFTDEVRAEIVRLAHRHDAIIVTDEVYEHLVFDGRRHVPIATLPGAAERTISISSAGKTFSVTGWKIGWATGPASLIDAVLTVKQFLTYVNGAPFQPAVAAGLRLDDAFFADVGAALQRKRDTLREGLTAAGFLPFRAGGSYFTVADAAPLGVSDAHQFCRRLPHTAGVVAIPLTAFAARERRHEYASLVRFAACKRPEVIAEAMRRLRALS
jgi:N-succinyldiaminopimelate aminotransferase